MNLALARRRPTVPKVTNIRALVPADLENLRQRSYRTRIGRLREVHHQMARYFAAGLSNVEVAEILGYTEARISVLRHDPSIKEITSQCSAEIHQSWLDHQDVVNADAVRAMKTGVRNIAERFEALEDDPNAIPLKDVARVTSDLMDRFGYGKQQTNVNVNLGFAKKLEDAITRSKKVINQ